MRAYNLVKIGVIGGVISSTESESEESSNVSDSKYDSVSYDPVKTRLSESETEAQELKNHKAQNRAL